MRVLTLLFCLFVAICSSNSFIINKPSKFNEPAFPVPKDFAQAATKRLVCYLGKSKLVRTHIGKLSVNEIDERLCSHVVVTSVNFDFNGQIITKNSVYDSISSLLEKLKILKSRNVKVLWSWGGWTENMQFLTAIIRSNSTRMETVNHLVNAIRLNGWDGIELNWAYTHRVAVDMNSQLALLQDLRRASNEYNLLLTVAVSSNLEIVMNSYNVVEITKYVDWVNVKTFNFDLDRSKRNFLVPLFGERENDHTISSVDSAVNMWLNLGVPAPKIQIGVPFIGRLYTLADSSKFDPGSAVVKLQILPYNKICQLLDTENWDIKWNEVQRVNWAVKGSQWLTWSSVRSVTEIAEYIQLTELGGLTVWDIGNDDHKGLCGVTWPLLKTASSILRGPSLQTSTVAPVTTSPSTTVSSTTTAPESTAVPSTTVTPTTPATETTATPSTTVTTSAATETTATPSTTVTSTTTATETTATPSTTVTPTTTATETTATPSTTVTTSAATETTATPSTTVTLTTTATETTATPSTTVTSTTLVTETTATPSTTVTSTVAPSSTTAASSETTTKPQWGYPVYCNKLGFAANPFDATKYFRCVPDGYHIKLIEMSCPQGLVFNPSLNICTSVETVTPTTSPTVAPSTTDATTTVTTSSPVEASTTTEATTTTTSSTTSTPSSSTVPVTTPTPSSTVAPVTTSTTTVPQWGYPVYCNKLGFAVNPYDATKFFRCVSNGYGTELIEMSCPAGLVFNKYISLCTSPAAVTPTTTSSTTTPSATCTPATTEATSTTTVSTCAQTSTTDSSTTTASTTVASTPTTTTEVSKTTVFVPHYGYKVYCNVYGFAAHPYDIKKFFRCETVGHRIKLTEFSCPSGLNFNIAINSCEWP